MSYSAFSCYAENQLVLQCVESYWVIVQPHTVYLTPVLTLCISSNNKLVLQCIE